MRESYLCDGPRKCIRANWVRCSECGYDWEADDTGTEEGGRVSSFTGNCPVCGSSGILVERCEICPVVKISQTRANSDAGRLLERVLERRFANEQGIDVGDLDAEEFLALQILKQENDKWFKEDSENKRREWEIEQRLKERDRQQQNMR